MTELHTAPIRLLDALARLQGRLRGTFSPVREGSGLNEMEHTLLAAVVESRMPPTVPQIGRSLGHPRQVIQRAANALADKGLIAFAANPEHKRASLLLATPQGSAAQAEANRKAEAISAKLLQQIDLAQFIAAIDRIEAIRTALDAIDRKSRK